MFQTNMKASRMPMSAWNLMGEKAQVATATPSVKPVSTTTLPVKASARPNASASGSPARRWRKVTVSTYSA